MLRYTTDATFLNEIVNHPEVRPTLGDGGAGGHLDVGVLLAVPGSFALVNDHGGFIFISDGGGGYEMHVQFLRAGRWRRAISAMIEACDLAFEAHGATILTAYVPHQTRAACGLARAAQFECVGRDDINSYWALTKEAWAKAPRASPAV